MLNAIIRTALQYRLLTVSLAALLLVYGVLVVRALPVDVFPDLNRPVVAIHAEAGGMAPEEVETLILLPLESVLNGATGVQRVRSTAAVGLAQIFVEFGWEMDIYRARQIVAEQLDGVRDRLPPGVEPQLMPITSIMGEILIVGLTSPQGTVDGMALRELADWVIRPRLQSVAGVAQVINIGGGVRQYQVRPDPARLAHYDLTLLDVRAALERANTTAAGGFLEQDAQELIVRGMGRLQSLQELRQAVVTQRDGVPVTIGDVAAIAFGPRQKRGDAGVDGGSGVLLSVQKQPGANTLELTRRVETALREIESALPPDVALHPHLFRQADFISAAIHNVEEALQHGALLVMLVLFLFLLNFRTTFITITAIPLSLLLSALVFHWMGLSVNTMTLGGLAVAIGELVDDSIVDVENVFRRLRENRFAPKPKPVLRVVYEASSEVRNSIVYATIIITLVFLPLFLMGGLEGRLFRPLGIAYITALLASLLVSLTVTPALASYLLPGLRFKAADEESPLVRWLKTLHRRTLEWVLSHTGPVLIWALAAVLISASLIPLMGREFLPPFNEGTATIGLSLTPGTNLTETVRVGQEAERLLLAIPEVRTVGRRTGRAEEDDHVEGPHHNEFEVDFQPGRPRDVVLGEIREALGALPGTTLSVGQPVSHRLDHMLSGVEAQIAVKLTGDDLAGLYTQGEAVRAIMERVAGVVDLRLSQQTAIPQVQVRLDRAAAARYGITAADLTDHLSLALSQPRLGQVLEGQRTFDLTLLLPPESRMDPVALGNLLIAGEHGPPVPLRLVADIAVESGPYQIQREHHRRRLVVSANVQGRDLGATVAELERRLQANLTLPPGYHVSVEGQFESQRQAARLMLIAGLASLLAIFLLLYLYFGLSRLAIQVLCNLPLAMIGGVLAIFFTGGVLSIASLVGFITVGGIVSRNGIMMIAHYLHLMEHEGEGFTRQMVIRGSLERLVPVLMTAVTAMLGLLPLTFAAGQPGKELLYPIAVVILGGLVSATFLNLIITPALFWRYGAPAYALVQRRTALDQDQGL